jgi:ribosomal protein S27AE
MGVKYVCKHCGYVIWEFKQVGQDYYGIPDPNEIMLVTGGFCPKCGHELHLPKLSDIKIKPKRRYYFSEMERSLNNAMSGGLLHSSVKTSSFMTAQEA